jgi:deferrochelatase/peroxidase EfeB
MQHSRCLVIESLPDNVARARALLRTLRDDIAYDDGRRLRRPAVVILGLGPRALRRLGLPQESVGTFPFAFVEGMTGPGRRTILGDDPDQWRWGGRGADAIVLVYAEDGLRLGLKCGAIRTAARKHGASAPHVIALEPLGENKREPFGFVDGISQPVIRGTYKGLRNADPIHLVEPGEFILGYPDSRGNLPPGPTLNALHDPDNLLPLVSPRGGFDRNQVESPRDVGFNGSFLAVRELEQDVHGFWRYCEAEAKRLKDHDLLPQPYVIDSDFIGAKLVGRWRDGSSLARFPYLSQTDARNRVRSHATQRAPLDPGQGLAPIGSPPPQHDSDGDNDFLFGAEDPEGLRCPYGAHVRRSNPRDSLAPGTADEIAITNRHRIIRCGRSLAAIGGRSPGILFMCLNGDLERQFEFVQQTWLRNPAFHGLTCEKDPLLGDGEEGACSFTVPTRQGPIRLKPMPAVTTLRGGGYFFLPGKRLINYLCAEHGA